MEIEVFADIWCPFAWIGLRTLQEARRRAGAEAVVVRVRPWPLELVNGRPQSAERTAEEIVQLRNTVAPTLFGGFRADRFPRSTLRALALAESGYDVSTEVGEALSFELRRRLFEAGEDIGDATVLEEAGRPFGLSVPTEPEASAVAEAALGAGRQRGVVGSPHFFLGASDYFCPALAVGRDESGELEVRFDHERLQAFLAAAFGQDPGVGRVQGG
jgi:2-hydroxychromene-2-carboxylate isomerase